MREIGEIDGEGQQDARSRSGEVNVPPGPEDSEGEGSSKRGTRVDGEAHPRERRKGNGVES